MLTTYTKDQSNTETQEFHHPDRLGTRLVTNNQANTSFEQSTLPFGTALSDESSGFSNQVFTSYDRSAATGLDYAVNRSYESGQGRFTQVDPAQDGLNLYAYANNDPINNTDPTGLNAEAFGTTYYLDGMEVDRRTIMQALGSGGAYVTWSSSDEITVINYWSAIKDGNSYSNWRFLGQSVHFWGRLGDGGQNNPDCIANALPNGKYTDRPKYELYPLPNGTVFHDGMHVYTTSEKDVPVKALTAMQGTLKYVRSQGEPKDSRQLYRLDIFLSNKIDGESYYLVLKDLTDVSKFAGGKNKLGARNIKVSGGEVLGSTRGETNPPSIDFKGLHATLVNAKYYSQYVRNAQKGKPSPSYYFMNPAKDERSPFKCP